MTTAQPFPRGEIIRQKDGTYQMLPMPTDDTLPRSSLTFWRSPSPGP